MTTKLFTDLEYNFKMIEEKICGAAQKAGKSREDITFLGATKTVSSQIINHAISLGLSYIGENRVQELLSKYEEYNLNDASLHFIGHLQTNKVKQIIDKVDLIHSVDSVKLANEISKCSKNANKTTDVLIEVNVGGESTKSGVLPERVFELIDEMHNISNINIIGLMSIPPICDNKTKILSYFDIMHQLFIDISTKKIDNISMDVLSMGMSDDYEEAILHGSNLIRIGSLLFGPRMYN